MTRAGFELLPGEHPIVPVMYGDAARAVAPPSACSPRGSTCIPFSFPVVPRGRARIRTQLSAAHTEPDVERAAAAFARARDEIGGVTAAPPACDPAGDEQSPRRS